MISFSTAVPNHQNSIVDTLAFTAVPKFLESYLAGRSCNKDFNTPVIDSYTHPPVAISGNMLASGFLNEGAGRTLQTLFNGGTSMFNATTDTVYGQLIDGLANASPVLRQAMILATPYFVLAMSSGYYVIKEFVANRISASVKIPGNHPLQQHILRYLVTEGNLGKNSRNLGLSMPNKKPSASIQHSADHKERNPEQLEYVPEVGSHSFAFHGYTLNFEREPSSPETQRDHRSGSVQLTGRETNGAITLSCRTLLGGTQPIQDFLTHVQAFADGSLEKRTNVYRPMFGARGNVWWHPTPRPARDMSAVTLDAHIKDPLVSDITDYLKPETRQFYIDCAIPYRRGLLFYGPPGTGKTTMATAMAGQFGLNVYLLSLSHPFLEDTSLEDLFDLLPERCILLLEDIDSSGIKREDMKQSASEQDDKAKANKQDGTSKKGESDDEPDRPTLAGLLNCLDGINAKEGRITIVTSNSPDSLDKALVRPGRVDRKVLFGYASHEVAEKLYLKIFSVSASKADIPALAKEFADLMPTGAITPAEVQGHLLENRSNPRGAVAKAADFFKEALTRKITGANVSAFANECDGSLEGKNAAGDGNGAVSPATKIPGIVSTGEDVAAPATSLSDTPNPTAVTSMNSSQPKKRSSLISPDRTISNAKKSVRFSASTKLPKSVSFAAGTKEPAPAGPPPKLTSRPPYPALPPTSPKPACGPSFVDECHPPTSESENTTGLLHTSSRTHALLSQAAALPRKRVKPLADSPQYAACDVAEWHETFRTLMG